MSGFRRAQPWVAAAWVAAAVCSAVLSGCVAPGPAPLPTDGASSPSVTAPKPSVSKSGGVIAGEGTWGAFPPNHLDAARDLSDPQFPKELSTFTLDGVKEGSASVTATYDDHTNMVSISATVLAGFGSYTASLRALQDTAYEGRAVCGRPTRALEQGVCLMVGQGNVLEMRSGNGVTMDQLVVFTEDLYDVL